MEEAQPSDTTAISNPFPVISSQYCYPHSLQIEIKRESDITDKFVVTDDRNNLVFQVTNPLVIPHKRRVLRDAVGNTIVTLQKKKMQVYDTWRAFKGESTKDEDLIFSVKRSSFIQWKINLEVFLANNQPENACDFEMKDVDFFKQSCNVYAGQSSTPIAQMKKIRCAYKVTVHPNTDSAFIAALIVILDDMGRLDKHTKRVFTLFRMMFDPLDVTGMLGNVAIELLMDEGVELLEDKGVELLTDKGVELLTNQGVELLADQGVELLADQGVEQSADKGDELSVDQGGEQSADQGVEQ